MRERNGRYRHELKYLCPLTDLAILEKRIAALLPCDAHWGPEGYTVSSLYFDTPDRNCLKENDAGTGVRSKYRIRLYNHRLEEIFLEKKEKRYGLCKKTSCRISEETLRALEAGKMPPLEEAEFPVFRQLLLQMKTRGMQPAAMIEYERHAYAGETGNVRITFDRNICASPKAESLYQERMLRCPVLPVGMGLMEVKFDALLPDYIRQQLQMSSLAQTTFSKYALGCKTLDEYWR